MRLAATSRLAYLSTMVGFLPPNSNVTGVMNRAAFSSINGAILCVCVCVGGGGRWVMCVCVMWVCVWYLLFIIIIIYY